MTELPFIWSDRPHDSLHFVPSMLDQLIDCAWRNIHKDRQAQLCAHNIDFVHLWCRMPQCHDTLHVVSVYLSPHSACHLILHISVHTCTGAEVSAREWGSSP